MSREIKFRAWDKLRKGMVPVTGLVWDNRGLALDTLDYRDTDQWERSGDYTLMQYTGLKDKNGVEIYEGDILSDGAVVEWFDNLAWDSGGSLHSGFYTKKWASQHSDDITTELSYHDGFDDCEVIGNIYEHPELLKAGDARDN